MITEKDLLNAIAECEAEPITASKVGKLADLYIIYDHLFGKPPLTGYSGAKPPKEIVYTKGGTAFLDAVDGREADQVWSIMDELMEVIRSVHPRMYDSVMDKLRDV